MKRSGSGDNRQAGRAPRGRRQGSPLWVYFAPGLLLMISLVLALTVLSSQLLMDAGNDSNRRNLAQLAQVTAARLSALIDERRNLLQLLSLNERVQPALAGGESQRLQSLADDFTQRVAPVMQLRLYPVAWVDQLKPDPDGPAPVGYAGIDMIKRALAGERPDSEVHQIAAGSPYLAMAVPVQRGGRVIGALFAAWPVELLTRVLSSAPAMAGEIQLLQGDADAYVIASSGAPGSIRQVQGSHPVKGTIWRLGYAAEAVEFGRDFKVLLGIGLAGTAAILLALWLQMRLFKRSLREDMATLVNLGEAIAHGQAGAERKARLAASADAILLLGEYALNSFKQRRKEAKTAPPQKPGSGPALASAATQEPQALAESTPAVEVAASLFRAYDVRGTVGQTLNSEVAYVLGCAFGEEAREQHVDSVCVAHDARLSSPELYKAFCDGLLTQGMRVLQMGQAPVALPYLYMHTHENIATVMVTGSHNPPEYNGFKLYINAQALQGKQLQALYERINQGGFASAGKKGHAEAHDMQANYLQMVSEQIQLGRPLRVVVDGGNGAAGELACALFQAIGCEVAPLFCEPDGNFPHHHPDPGEPQNLGALQLEVQAQEADLGIAFDGDGDRLGVVDNTGRYVWPEHVLMLLATDVLQRHPGTDVVFDVKSSRHLAAYVLANGGRPIMARSGHTRMKEKMRETGALVGGEFSGHFFIKERWYGSDDAIYVAARLLEVLALDPRPLDQVLADLPHSAASPEYHMPVEEGEAPALMRAISARVDFDDARLLTLDGLRVEFSHGWGLVRGSNTTPSLSFRFEADSEEALQEIQQKFRDLVNQVLPAAHLPF